MTPEERAAAARDVAEATLKAVDACQAALVAVNEALALAGQLGVVGPGWQQLMAIRPYINAIISEHGQCVVLAKAELHAAKVRNGR